jgi:hypothetical protein
MKNKVRNQTFQKTLALELLLTRVKKEISIDFSQRFTKTKRFHYLRVLTFKLERT